jgi:hypothetical protein
LVIKVCGKGRQGLMKDENTIDWKYVLLVSLIVISLFMTALGMLMESF